MLKEHPGFATCFPTLRHKTRDNPAATVPVLRVVPQAGQCPINSVTKKRYTVPHVWLTDASDMDITHKSRIQWACRRGMRELDVSIMPFFEYEFDSLDDTDKQLFVRLLENDDPDLFNWLMNHGEPADAELKRMVTLIQERNKQRGPVAM